MPFAMFLALMGCQDGSVPVADTHSTPDNSAAAETWHTLGDADKLVWVRSDIEEGELLISPGHHGEHIHAGHHIEPAISISRGEEDVSDAVVYNSLVAEEDRTVLCEEQATVFEPKTDEEPAHDAQGGLTIPKETPTFRIRFRFSCQASTLNRHMTSPRHKPLTMAQAAGHGVTFLNTQGACSG